MQWIFMLVGLVLGALAGESVTSALLGGLIGQGLGQALRLHQLASDNARLRQELKGFAERFERGTTAVVERLVRLESGQPAGAAAEPQAPAAATATPPRLEPEPAPVEAGPLPESPADELVWELPELPATTAPEPQLQAEPVAAPVEPSPSPRPATPRQPAPPREPSPIARAFALAKAWLLGGNTVLRVGVVLLFLGLAFLLRYATEGMVVPVELRYAGVAASAIALLGLGWWLRRRNPSYGLMLQGTGIAVLYLTVFAAMRLHPLLDPKLALGLLVLVTAFSAILAVAQNALGLAVAAALGGFAAPILTSTGSGNHVALFSYFILLNAGILAIAGSRPGACSTWSASSAPSASASPGACVPTPRSCCGAASCS